MKKTLVALAAVAATSAFAQSSVTMYGIVDMSYGTSTSTNVGGSSTKTTGIHEGTMAGNRIGFRGVEDLGGGLKAGFLVEQGLSLTSGDMFGNRAATSGHQNNTGTPAAGGGSLWQGLGAYSNSTNRQSFASLAGSFGEARIGYQYTNLYVLSSLSGFIVGPEISGGDHAHTWGSGAVKNGAAGNAQTVDVGGTRANGLTYISPSFAGGFNASVQYGSGQSAATNAGVWTTSTTSDTGAVRTGFKLDYANGPLKGALAYTTNKKTAAGVAQTHKLTQLGGSYDFGVAKLVATYNTGNDGNATQTSIKSRQIGVNVPFGATEVFAAFGAAKADKSGTGNVSDLKQTQVGAKYNLSKRSYLFFVNGVTKDAASEKLALGTSYKGSTTRFGVNHSF